MRGYGLLGMLALAGCWIDNPNYRPPPPDMTGCGRDPMGGGGGKGRPEVLVRGGSFMMQGVPVTLVDFWLDVYEVTVRAYRECFDAGQCTKPMNNSSLCN